MAVTEVPFDLVEVKLAAPSTRPDNGGEGGSDRTTLHGVAVLALVGFLGFVGSLIVSMR